MLETTTAEIHPLNMWSRIQRYFMQLCKLNHDLGSNQRHNCWNILLRHWSCCSHMMRIVGEVGGWKPLRAKSNSFIIIILSFTHRPAVYTIPVFRLIKITKYIDRYYIKHVTFCNWHFRMHLWHISFRYQWNLFQLTVSHNWYRSWLGV